MESLLINTYLFSQPSLQDKKFFVFASPGCPSVIVELSEIVSINKKIDSLKGPADSTCIDIAVEDLISVVSLTQFAI